MTAFLTQKLIRLPEVIERTGLSRSAIYDRISHNQFPRQINLGARAVAWEERKIAEWIDTKIKESLH